MNEIHNVANLNDSMRQHQKHKLYMKIEERNGMLKTRSGVIRHNTTVSLSIPMFVYLECFCRIEMSVRNSGLTSYVSSFFFIVIFFYHSLSFLHLFPFRFDSFFIFSSSCTQHHERMEIKENSEQRVWDPKQFLFQLFFNQNHTITLFQYTTQYILIYLCIYISKCLKIGFASIFIISFQCEFFRFDIKIAMEIVTFAIISFFSLLLFLFSIYIHLISPKTPTELRLFK